MEVGQGPNWGCSAIRKKGTAVPVLNRSGGIAPPFFTSALDGCERSASRPGRFTAGIEPQYHWIGGCVGRRAGLDDVEKRTLSCLCRESNPGRPDRRYTN
jgi:hypothetical protein